MTNNYAGKATENLLTNKKSGLVMIKHQELAHCIFYYYNRGKRKREENFYEKIY